MNDDSALALAAGAYPVADTVRPLGIRKFWAAYLAWSTFSFALFTLPYLALEGPPRPFLIAQALIDLAALYPLFGYVVRRPIRHLAFRILIMVLVLIFATRAALTVYFIGPILLPWRGDSESLVSASLLFYGVPCQLLMALALFRHANTDWVYPQRKSGDSG